jgi:spore maturation protein CgeB
MKPSSKPIKIIFLGSLPGKWTSGWQRCRALKDLGHEVVEFPQHDFLARAGFSKSMRLLTGRFYDERIIEEFNRQILSVVATVRPAVAWLEWPLLVRRETLQRISVRYPGCRLVSFQDDNPFGSRTGEARRWELFLDAIPEYDLHFVKRESDTAEYQRRGAQRTLLFMHGAYAPLFHPLTPSELRPELSQDVSFVGTPLDRRADFISKLLGRKGVRVRVYGGRWNRTLVYHLRKECFRPPVLAEDYVRVICGSKISLGLVSTSNRDEYTMRTFEIPACRGFLLAQRTPKHQELFQEGKEAEYFGSEAECADKIGFYLRRDSARNRIAEQGHRRCASAGYSLHQRLTDAMEQIQMLEA